MALKTKKSKRSLTTLKRTEPSNAERERLEFTRGIVYGTIDPRIMIEDVDPRQLAKYPSLDDIIAEFNKDLETDKYKGEEYIQQYTEKYSDHPINQVIYLCLIQELAKVMNDDEKAEFFDNLTNPDAIAMEADQDLTEKIYNTMDLASQGRAAKAQKSIEACIRRIEAKRTPRTYKAHKVLSISSPEEMQLYKNTCIKENNDFHFEQAPAPYDVAYFLHASMLYENDKLFEAENALKELISWNPVSAEAYLLLAEIQLYTDPEESRHTLDKAYPLAISMTHMVNYYMHACDLIRESDTDLYYYIQKLIYQISQDEIVKILLDNSEAAKELPQISKAELEKRMSDAGIHFGPSKLALEALNDCIKAMEDIDADETLRLKEVRDSLSSCMEFDMI